MTEINEKALEKLPIELRIEIEENIHRKGYTQSELAEIQKFIRAELSKYTEPGRRTDLGKETSSKILEEVDHGTLEVVSKLFGESHETTRKRMYIFNHEKEAKEVVEKLDRGEISVHQAYEKVKSKVEPKPKEEKEKTWKCDACEHEFSELDPVAPTRYTLCPDCLVEFETWKAEKLYDSD